MIRGELGRSVDRSIGEKEEELWLHLARRLIDSYTVIPDTEMDVVERKEKGGRTKLRTKKAKREGGEKGQGGNYGVSEWCQDWERSGGARLGLEPSLLPCHW